MKLCNFQHKVHVNRIMPGRFRCMATKAHYTDNRCKGEMNLGRSLAAAAGIAAVSIALVSDMSWAT